MKRILLLTYLIVLTMTPFMWGMKKSTILFIKKSPTNWILGDPKKGVLPLETIERKMVGSVTNPSAELPNTIFYLFGAAVVLAPCLFLYANHRFSRHEFEMRLHHSTSEYSKPSCEINTIYDLLDYMDVIEDRDEDDF